MRAGKQKMSPINLFDNFEREVIRGRKALMAFFGVRSWKTMRRYRDKYRMPFLTGPNGRPWALRCELIRYLIILNELLEKERKTDKGSGEK